MYTSFFGLKEKPFSITPDPRYLFMSERHAEALAHLMYGVNEAGGFVQLTGDIGTGKTTLVRTMLEKMPQHADVAVILNPRISPQELLLSICQELAIVVSDAAANSSKSLVDMLNIKLLAAHAQGRRVIVIVDEAQNLSADTLEQVRLLTNLETPSAKLMQIILIGQPELRDVLAHSGLKQLAQRITGRYHLAPLTREDSIAYIRHRLKIAGATGEIFTNAALREAYRLTAGVPRLINVVCDRALLGAYTEDQHRIDAATVRRAASEVFGKTISPRWIVWAGAGAAVVAVVTLAIGAQQLQQSDAGAKSAAPQINEPPAENTTPLIAPTNAHMVPAAADIATLLATGQPQTTIENAFTTLLGLWGATFSKDVRPCDQAQSQGLECVYQKGSWGQLRILDRPVILSLTDDAGGAHQVVLTKLSDTSAFVALDGTTSGTPQEVSLSSLSRVWLGDYLLLWRPQVAEQRALAIGTRGNEVRWLRRSLDSLEKVSGAPDSDYYNEALAKRVEEFQRMHRLTVDGIAGTQTQIALDSAVDTSTAPHLLTSQPTVANNAGSQP
jgi:general secretion pathway protein A